MPYLPVLVIEIAFLGYPKNIFTWLASGGYQMPGSYYVVLMIQLIVLFPVIKKFYNWNSKHLKNCFIGLAIVFFFQCVFEWLTYIIDLPDTIYRLLIFRYTIFLYAGICIRKMLSSNTINWKILIGMIPFGVVYIGVTGYLNWQPHFLFRYPVWYHSSAPTILWAFPIIMYILWNGKQIHILFNKFKISKSLYNVLILCGKASYHIYIFQMLWFGMIINKFNISSAIDQIKAFCVSACICCLGGIIYYCLGKNIRFKKKIL